MGCASYRIDDDSYFRFGEDSDYWCLCTFDGKTHGKEGVRSLAILGAAMILRPAGDYVYPKDLPAETLAEIAEALGLPLAPPHYEDEGM